MTSTFMGLETGRRGLYTQQSALYTTGHNLSNANTLGYSRQRVNMQPTSGFPRPGLNASTIPGHLGTGVEAGSIERIRDKFIDHQYRQESNKLGYWESRSNAVTQMEDVLTEPSEHGLAQSMTEFWKSLQDLANDPENRGARSVVVQRGLAIADSFSHMHKSLTDIQNDIGTEIGNTAGKITSLLEQIAGINDQIKDIEPNGYLPNDLYDSRDLLLDELSEYIPIEISYEKSGGRAQATAEGMVTVKLKTNGESIELVSGDTAGKFEVQDATTEGNPSGSPLKGFTVTSADGSKKEIEIDDMLKTGKLRSLVESYGHGAEDDVKGLYPEMLAKLDKMAAALAKAMNEVHKDGYDLTGEKGEDFFVITDGSGEFNASNLTVNEAIQDDPNKIAASSEIEQDSDDEKGNGENAHNMSDVLYGTLDELDGASLQTYFQGLIGQLGVDGEQAERMTSNTVTLLGSIEHRRDSVSAVSMDEEMTNMIQFQHAYNASARMITAVDESLDKIINGMGRVGI